MGARHGVSSQKLASASSVPLNNRLTLRGGCDEGDGEKPAEEPKGFDLDAWKRLYSNTANTETILPEFWAKFDKEVR